MSFSKNIEKNIGKNISKDLLLNLLRNLLIIPKKSARDAFKNASKWAIQKPAEATGDLIGKKSANKITKVPNTSQQNNSQTVANEYDKEILKEKYIYIYIYIYI